MNLVVCRLKSRFFVALFEGNENKKSEDAIQQKITPFQRERVGPLLQEFFNRFPPTRQHDQQDVANGGSGEPTNAGIDILAHQEQSEENRNNQSDQPVEKKKKI